MESDLNLFAEKFRKFRLSRTGHTQIFPRELKTEALELKKKYGFTAMKKTCGLSSSTISNWEHASKFKDSVSNDRRIKKSSVADTQPVLLHTKVLAPQAIIQSAQQNPPCIIHVKGLRIEMSDADFLARTLTLLQQGLGAQA
jgi:hypothetical protein